MLVETNEIAGTIPDVLDMEKRLVLEGAITILTKFINVTVMEGRGG